MKCLSAHSVIALVLAPTLVTSERAFRSLPGQGSLSFLTDALTHTNLKSQPKYRHAHPLELVDSFGRERAENDQGMSGQDNKTPLRPFSFPFGASHLSNTHEGVRPTTAGCAFWFCGLRVCCGLRSFPASVSFRYRPSPSPKEYDPSIQPSQRNSLLKILLRLTCRPDGLQEAWYRLVEKLQWHTATDGPPPVR